MKRMSCVLIILALAALVALPAFSEPQAFASNKIVITEDEINTALVSHEIFLEQRKEALNDPDVDVEEAAELLEEAGYFSYDTVVEDLFRRKVQVAEGERLGLEGSGDEAARQVVDIDRMFRDPHTSGSEQALEIMEELMERVGLSDDEYLSLRIRTAKDDLTIANLIEWFYESDENRDRHPDELELLYEIYVDELMRKYRYEIVE